MTAFHGGDIRSLAIRARRDAAMILDFSANINPLGPPDGVRAALEAFARDASELSRYPDPDATELRVALARRHHVTLAEIAIANGSAAMIAAIVRASGAKRCVVPVPAFSEYAKALRASGTEAVVVPVAPHALADATERIVRAARETAAGLCLLANPNNPTGASLSRASVITLARELAAVACRLVVDEAFVDYEPAASIARDAVASGAIVIRSLTKFYAIPGVRVGYAIARDDVRGAIAATLPSWPIGAIETRIALAAIADPDYDTRTKASNARERARFRAALEGFGLGVFPSSANFLFADVAPLGVSAAAWSDRLLRDAGIAVRVCDDYHGLPTPTFVRIAVRSPADDDRLLGALAASGARAPEREASRSNANRRGDRVTETAERKPINDGTTPAPPCTLVIFGAGGDLTKRLLAPALYNLAGSGLLSDGLQILGLDHNDRTTDDWKNDLSQTMQSFTKDKTAEFHADRIDEKQWAFVTDRLSYLVADFEDPASYTNLKSQLETLGAARNNANAIFYLAVADRFFGTIVDRLGDAGLLEEKDGAFRRVVIEKPFGADLPSAKALNERITRIADESQIYRIDHFLGKEPVQSIMAMRFGNGLFEPMWRREHVDHVQITAAETIGVEERGGFYEATGALRDMVPNHLFQLLTMITMEAPNSFEPENVRSEKAKLVEAIRPVEPHNVVRGQYGAGSINGKPVVAYRDEHNVAKDSATETYAALRVDIENWRWSGVPFYLRTGKRLGTRLTTISIHFKSAPYRIFRDTPVEKMTPNVLTLLISPKQGMTTDFSAKVPGPAMRLGRVSTEFMYDDFFDETPNVGYETLIYDCMIGDATLFQRADQIDSSWAAVQPTRDAWNAGTSEPLEIYAAGSDGPAAADALLARDERKWAPLTTDADARRQAASH